MKKYSIIKIIFSFLVVILSANTLHAQCDIVGTATPTVLCAGNQLELSSNGSCGYLMSNNFNTGTIGMGWSSTNANPVFTNPCPPPGPSAGPNSFYLWVGTTSSPQRSLITNAYDVSIGGCVVEFWMRYGLESGSGPCEDPDYNDEGVYLEYTTNGTTWTTFSGPDQEPIGNLNLVPPFTTTTPGTGGYWQPHSGSTAQQASTLYHWNAYSCPVPAAAASTTTQFRWIQKSNSSAGWDAWGIDQVNISCPTPAAQYAWITPATGDTVFTVADPPIFIIYDPVNPSTITGGQYDTCWFVSIWDSLGYSAIDTVCVTVNPGPTASYTLNSLICQDDSSSFLYTGNATPAATYTWDFDGGTVLSGANQGPITVQWATPGVKNISLQVTENGCSSPVKYDSVVVNAVPAVQFSADTTKGCQPMTIQFTNESVPAGSNWLWDFGNGSTSTQENPSVTYNSSGNYDVSLIVSTDIGCTDTLEINNYIEIYPQPVANFIITPNPAAFGSPVNFGSASIAESWLWDFGDGNTDTTANFTTHSYQSPGEHIVTLYLTNQYGCSDSISHEITIIAPYTFYVPNAFTPDNDGINDIFMPKGRFVDEDRYEFMIFNRWGQTVFETKDVNEGWDGGVISQDVESTEHTSSVYIYVIKLYDVNGDYHEYKGKITLVR
jgi:gliding motility-associated-like protein